MSVWLILTSPAGNAHNIPLTVYRYSLIIHTVIYSHTKCHVRSDAFPARCDTVCFLLLMGEQENIFLSVHQINEDAFTRSACDNGS